MFPNGITNPDEIDETRSYFPICNLLRYDRKRGIIEAKFVEMVHKVLPKYQGVKDAVSYPLAEFVANIFDHSLSDKGYVFAQYYPFKGYLDMCVLDRGRGLRRSYKEEKNRDYTPLEAIQRALAGESTKKEDYRGTGIPTSQKVICKGLNGKMTILSESAAAIITRKPTFFNISNFSWKGTIVSFRIPKPKKPIDIYKFLSV